MDDLLRRDRKNNAFWGVLMIASVLRVFDYITSDQWVNIAGIDLAGFMVGNVGEHMAKRKG